jgi:DNA-binding helix-hairpin-helix protein with protein kinase domain
MFLNATKGSLSVTKGSLNATKCSLNATDSSVAQCAVEKEQQYVEHVADLVLDTGCPWCSRKRATSFFFRASCRSCA